MAKGEQSMTIADIDAQQAALKMQMEELQKQKEMIAKKDYFDLLNTIKDKKIPLAAFSAFLAEQVAEEGILIKYTYNNDKNQEKVYIYKNGQKGKNTLKEHLEQKKITKEQAYSYVKKEEAKKLIDTWAPAS